MLFFYILQKGALKKFAIFWNCIAMRHIRILY
jgi:hypothetical protein